MEEFKHNPFFIFLLFLKSIFFVLLPYICIQTFLRLIITISSINHFFSSSFFLLPISFLAGFIYDLFCGLHFALFLLLLLLAVPFQIRSSAVGKLISFLFVFLLSFFIVSVFFTEIFFWFKYGSRFYDGMGVYFADFLSTIKGLHTSYGWYFSAIFIAVMLGLAFAFAKVIVIRNVFGNSLVAYFSQTSTFVYLGTLTIFLLFCDIYHSRFDLIATIRSGRTINSNNRYLTEVAKNGFFETIVKSFSGIWSFEDLYLSIPRNNENAMHAALKNATANKGIAFIDDESDISSPQMLKTSRRTNKENRYNVIVIMMDDFSQKGIKFNRERFDSMPYLSSLARKSIFFENFHATSARKNESIFALLFSLVPVKRNFINLQKGDLFSLPNLLKSNGYDVKSFHNRFYSGGDELCLFLRSGFSSKSLDIASKRIYNIGNVREHEKKIEFEMPINSTNNLTSFVEQVFLEADAASANNESFFYVISSSFFAFNKKGRGPIVDSNIRAFFEEAEKKEWFKDTAFVFIGTNAGKNESKSPINPSSHIVPFFIKLPTEEFIVSKSYGSHIDFAAVMAGVLGINYISKFQGNDILSSQSSGSVILKSGEFFGYIKDEKMGILAPYKRWNLYEKCFKQQVVSVSRRDIEGVIESEHYYSPSATDAFRPFDLLKKENYRYIFGRCKNCYYKNVSWDEDAMVWRAGRVYKKYISKNIIRKKQAPEAMKDPIFLLEMIAVMQNNVIAYDNMEEIKYNVLFDDKPVGKKKIKARGERSSREVASEEIKEQI